MLKSMKVAVASVVFSLGLSALPAAADPMPIIGSITVTGAVCPTCLPTPPSTSIVSALTSITHYLGLGTTTFAIGDFTGLTGFQNASMTSWSFAGPFPNIISVGGFTFDLTGAGAAVASPAFSCGTGSCADGLTIALSGIVSGNGYLPTAFTGSLLLSGSCVSSNGSQCTSLIQGGYTYSISASGVPLPEPGTLALLAVGLLGLGLLRSKVS